LAVTGYGFSPEQRLNSGKRGEGVDFVHLGKQIGHAGVGHLRITEPGGLVLGGTPGTESGDDIGMGFIEDKGVGPGLAYGLKQSEVGFEPGGTEPDRGVGFDLARD
jgi:hypothetical protein